MHQNENVVVATKLPSPAVLEVIILTTSSAASNENLRDCRFCAWAVWKHGHVESPHANARCWSCNCDHSGHSQWSKGFHSTHVTESQIFALSCCYKYSNWFHHSRNYINQSSTIWYGGKQGINYASWTFLPNVGGICLIIPVYDASKRCKRHKCGLDISEVDRDFESRFRATCGYM